MKRLEAHLFSAETKIQPFVEQKVQEWVHCVEKLTKASESQPQAAQMALTKSLQFEWAYLQRVVPNCADAFEPLRDTINQKFWPTVLGEGISQQEKILFSLPTRKGGLGSARPSGVSTVFTLRISRGNSEDSTIHQGKGGVLCAGTQGDDSRDSSQTEGSSEGARSEEIGGNPGAYGR